MTTLDYYTMRAILRPLATALVVALMIFMIERVLRLLELILGATGPLKVVLEIMTYLVPHYMSIALPLSFLIGLLIGFNQLSRDGELDALQAAGISRLRLLKSALIAAVAMTLIAAGILGYLKPYGRYAFQAIIYTISNASIQSLVRANVFTELGSTTLLVQEIRAEEAGFGRVFIVEGESGGERTVITANRGQLAQPAMDQPPILRLFDGIRMILPADPAVAPASPDGGAFGIVRFDELRTGIGDDEFRVFRPRGKDERELTMSELWQQRDAPPPDVRVSDMDAEFHSRIVRSVSILLLPLLAFPLALGRRRSDRSTGIVVAILLLIGYDRVLDLGKNLAETADVSVWVGLWLPFFAFAGFSAALFHHVATSVPTSGRFAVAGFFGRVVAPVLPAIANRRARS
ncbi:MAG: LPS export ABC transporter permease LptF [Rhodospirillales bacterium]